MRQHPSSAGDMVEKAVELVVAYVSSNAVPASNLPALIDSVYRTLASLSQSPVIPTTAPLPSASKILASVRPDGIVSFIDGRPYKALKRHLSGNGLSPKRYRSRFGLPADYPMTAPSYSARRSAIAKHIQLGRKAG